MKYAAITLVFLFSGITSIYGGEFYSNNETYTTFNAHFIEECCEDTPLNYVDNTENTNKSKSVISLYPSPAIVGKNVTINNIDVGQVISIFEQSGKFIKSQIIDIDKQIYTADLNNGEYIIRAEALYLKLLVE